MSRHKREFKNVLRLVVEHDSYEELEESISKSPIIKPWIAMEAFAKIFFSARKQQFNIEKYYSKRYDSIPAEIEVNTRDLGTDGIIVHTDGKISRVQVKFRQNKYEKFDRGALGGMGLEALALKESFGQLYLFTNTYDGPTYVGALEREKVVKYVLYDTIKINWDLPKSTPKKL